MKTKEQLAEEYSEKAMVNQRLFGPPVEGAIYDAFLDGYDARNAEVSRLAKENEELRKALEFYANKSDWIRDEKSEIEWPIFSVARAALKKGEL